MTLQDAIGTSMNTPAIQALESVVYEVGRNEVVSYLKINVSYLQKMAKESAN